MVFGCGNTCVKYILFITNFLVCLAGLALLGTSLWANLDGSVLEKLQTALDDAGVTDVNLKNYSVALWVAVGVGALVFAIGFLGCCGAMCENRCFLILVSVYIVLLGLLFLAQLGIAIWILVNKANFNDELKSAFSKIEDSQKLDALKPVEDLLHCCGVDGATASHPCQNVEAQYRKTGCLKAAEDFFQKWSLISAIVAIFVLVVELVSIVFACVLFGAIRDSNY